MINDVCILTYLYVHIHTYVFMYYMNISHLFNKTYLARNLKNKVEADFNKEIHLKISFQHIITFQID